MVIMLTTSAIVVSAILNPKPETTSIPLRTLLESNLTPKADKLMKSLRAKEKAVQESGVEAKIFGFGVRL